MVTSRGGVIISVADKREIRSGIRKLQSIRTWQLFLALVLMLFVSATFLRLNNIGMVERRAAVIAADEQGNEAQIQNRLYDLQRYVSAHMNTNPGRIALTEQYARDSQEIKDRAEQAGDSNPNGNIYKKAADVCDPIGRAQGWRWPDPRYTACIDRELSKYPEAQELTNRVELPDPTLYYHTFTSPVWSPDFAGFSLLISGLILLMICIRGISLVVLRLLLSRHYSSV